jgi:STAS-like domain of unknown function (DUF4325)
MVKKIPDTLIDWYARNPGFGSLAFRSSDGKMLANVQTFDTDGLCHVIAAAPVLLGANLAALEALKQIPVAKRTREQQRAVQSLLAAIAVSCPETPDGEHAARMTGTQRTLHIASQFSRTPGAGRREVGPKSGQEFREVLLEPAFQRVMAEHAVLLVDLDGGYGYCSDFLAEAFGGLAGRFGATAVHKHLLIKTKDEPYLEKDIWGYIARGKPPVD